MTKAGILLLAVLFLAVIGSFTKTLLNVAGIPNFLSPLRDLVLIGLFFFGMKRLDIYESQALPLFISLLSLFIIIYIFASIFQDSLFVGLFYLRSYLLPLIFFLTANALLFSKSSGVPLSALRGIIVWWNISLFIAALSIYILLDIAPWLRGTLFGSETLPTAWFISGGIWMRMGLPLVSPNALGLNFALNGIFLMMLLGSNKVSDFTPKENRLIVFGVGISIVGLVLTFSRSSLLALAVATPLTALQSRSVNWAQIGKIVFGFFIAALIVTVVGFVADIASEGAISLWISLNTSSRDPSMHGHWDSIIYALEHWHEYFWMGYPRGTVGALAFVFAGVTNNVENSLLAIFFDMGFPIGLLFICTYAALFSYGYKNKAQIIFIVAFLVPSMLLPYILEANSMMYFLFLYLALGRLVDSSERTSGVKAPIMATPRYIR